MITDIAITLLYIVIIMAFVKWHYIMILDILIQMEEAYEFTLRSL